MKIEGVRSAGLTKPTVADYTQGRPEHGFFPPSQAAASSLEADINTKSAGAPVLRARTVVEQRFMSMTEAHDRIRTQVLGSHEPDAA